MVEYRGNLFGPESQQGFYVRIWCKPLTVACHKPRSGIWWTCRRVFWFGSSEFRCTRKPVQYATAMVAMFPFGGNVFFPCQSFVQANTLYFASSIEGIELSFRRTAHVTDHGVFVDFDLPTMEPLFQLAEVSLEFFFRQSLGSYQTPWLKLKLSLEKMASEISSSAGLPEVCLCSALGWGGAMLGYPPFDWS